MKKALIVTGRLVQDHEFIYPYYRLKEAGFDIFVALPRGWPVIGSLGTKIPCDDECTMVNHDDISQIGKPDLLVIPGGAKCMEYLRQDKEVLRFIREYNDRNGVIASICHGAQMLISARVVKDRKISGYYSIEDDIINAGAEYVNAPFVTDRNIVTCPHYKHMGPWMKEVLRVVNENSSH